MDLVEEEKVQLLNARTIARIFQIIILTGVLFT